MGRFAFGISTCMGVLCLAAHVRAQPAVDPDVARIRDMVLHAQYRDAITAAQTYLARTDLGARQRNSGLEALATAQIARRDESGAAATLRQLYARDPGHEVADPDVSPVVRAAFARAHDAPPPAVTVTLTHELVSSEGDPDLRFHVTAGADAVDQLRVAFRHAGEPGYASVTPPIDPGGAAQTRIPRSGPASRAEHFEWYLEALAPSGATLAHVGSADTPEQIDLAAVRRTDILPPTGPTPHPPTVRHPGSPGIASRWWFWTAVGVVVVGGAVGGYVLLGPPSQETPEGTLGTRSLR